MITVALAADDAFSGQLAVCARSLLANYPGVRGEVRFVILDGGISAGNRERIESVLNGASTAWHDCSALYTDLTEGQIGSHAAYYRLALPELCDGERVLYLDCDIVVLGDVGVLWEADLDGCPLAAAVDYGGATAGSRQGLLNYRELGLPPDAPLFNSGVMIIDLQKWREEDISEKVRSYVARSPEFVRWCDQDGLNAVCCGRWKALDPAWNQQAFIYGWQSAEDGPLTAEEYERALVRPCVVHYSTRHGKPWRPDCRHPLAGLYFHYLDMTPWAGWRPAVPAAQSGGAARKPRGPRALAGRVVRGLARRLDRLGAWIAP